MAPGADNGALTFCQSSIDEILAHANANISCLQVVESCAPKPLPYNQPVQGSLATSDCTDGYYRDEYYIDSTNGGNQIVVTMTSSEFDPYLILEGPLGLKTWEDNNGGGGTSARLPASSGTLTLPYPGRYILHASSYNKGETGNYTLTLSNTATSCTYSISPSSGSHNAAGGSNSFNVTTQAGCGWTAQSSASWITTNSTGSGSGTVSYTVAQNTTTSTRTGTISVGGQTFTVGQQAGSAPTDPCTTAAAISFGQTVSGALATSDCAVTLSDGNQYYTDYFAFNGTAGQQISTTMTSSDFDTYLILEGPGGSGRWENNDGGGGTTARIPEGSGFFTLPATGQYKIQATSNFATNTGSYSLNLTLNTTPAPTPTPTPNPPPANPSPVRWDLNFNSEFFVRQHYRDFFSREADAAGLSYWKGQIDECGSNVACAELRRANVSAAFFLSTEFQQTGYLVYLLYNVALARPNGMPSYVELIDGTRRVGSGVVVGQAGWEAKLEQNRQQFLNDFVANPEFVARYPQNMSGEAYVDALYANAKFTPTAAERQAAINEFQNPTGARARALRKVAESPTLSSREYDRAFVLMQYFGYLRRNPADAPDGNMDGYNFWLGKLNNHGGNYISAEMVKAFITSGEYIRRFGQ